MRYNSVNKPLYNAFQKWSTFSNQLKNQNITQQIAVNNKSLMASKLKFVGMIFKDQRLRYMFLVWKNKALVQANIIDKLASQIKRKN
jgi:hypothetical protein